MLKKYSMLILCLLVLGIPVHFSIANVAILMRRQDSDAYRKAPSEEFEIEPDDTRAMS